MVERLANKLREIYGGAVDEYYPGPPAEKEAAIAESFEEDARDILAAIREPTADMVMFNGAITGRDDAGFGLTEGDAISSWRGFIDGALK